VNRLPPVGLRPFSVGDIGAPLGGVAVVGVVVVVVVVGVLDGAGPPVLPHPAVNAPSAISIAAEATANRPRVLRREFLMQIPFISSVVRASR
jgi:hypothetical protein